MRWAGGAGKGEDQAEGGGSGVTALPVGLVRAGGGLVWGALEIQGGLLPFSSSLISFPSPLLPSLCPLYSFIGV